MPYELRNWGQFMRHEPVRSIFYTKCKQVQPKLAHQNALCDKCRPKLL